MQCLVVIDIALAGKDARLQGVARDAAIADNFNALDDERRSLLREKRRGYRPTNTHKEQRGGPTKTDFFYRGRG